MSATPKGYGMAWHEGRMRPAHRVIYERIVGPVPVDLQLDHLCRNKRCVNPGHLEVVTNAENQQRGPHIKLDAEKVRLIRCRAATGESQHALAAAFGVSRVTIRNVITRRTWGNIP